MGFLPEFVGAIHYPQTKPPLVVFEGIVPPRVELRDGSSEWIGNLRDLRRLINVGVKSGVIAA